MSTTSRIVSLAAALMAAAIPLSIQATPYASCITNGNGNVAFYLNENGGNVVVTYDDGTTNSLFNGINTGTNLNSGQYNFSITGHSTYAITVTKMGNGTAALVPSVLQNSQKYGGNPDIFVTGNMRGVDVNKNEKSPYFGRIYLARSSAAHLWDFNSDGSFAPGGPGSAGTTCGVSWTASDGGSPWRLSVAPDDSLIVADFSIAGSAIYRIDPNLQTNQVLLNPVGATLGYNLGVHGSEESRPLVLGDLNSGATLVVIDGDLGDTSSSEIGGSANNETHDNSLMVYSNLTYNTLPWESAPSVWGPSVGLSYYSGEYLYNVYAGLSAYGNYIYCSQQRSGVSAGDPPFVQVYDLSFTNMVWNSRYNAGTSDYFFTSGFSPCDVDVSPDGKYLATMSLDNHLTICALTNGIPDPSTIYTVAGTSTSGGRGICWDAGDNIYTISSGEAVLQAWTLGLSTKATTVGTSSGTTSFNLTYLNPAVSVYATNPPAISQANTHGNPTTGYFTIVRSGGNLSLPLTVNFTYGGTATNGTYTTGSASGVTFAAGQTTTNIQITAVTDNIARLTTYLTLTVSPSSTYTLQPGSATISILNTATPYLIPSVAEGSMYNAFSNDYASVTITRLGDTNTILTVNNFTTTGSATNGMDYSAPTAVTFQPGDLTKITYIYPLIAGHAPVHSTTLPFTGNKTVVVGVGAGTGYTPAPGSATLTIVDSASPPAPVLYSDPLSDSTGSDAAYWNILGANGDSPVWPLDVTVQFGYDLTTVSGDTYAIPFPPNGSRYALRMTVNKGGGQGIGGGPETAVNAYLTNQTFSGNFAIRFNMNLIETGNLTEEGYPNTDYGSASGIFNNEEGALFGFNHNGMETNWYSGEINFYPSAMETSWAADGLFYWVSDSGGSAYDGYSPYVAFAGNGSPSTNQGFAIIGSQSSANFTTAFKTNVFTSPISTFVPPYDSGWTEGGPGLAANGSANYGLSVSTWSDVEIKQLNGVVTMSIDKTPIFVYTNTTIFNSGVLMLGYEDPYNGGEDSDAAVYYSNLRVVSIGAPVVTSMASMGSNVVMNFSVTDDGSSFTVQSASQLAGPYANVAATITPLGNGSFQVVAPKSGAIQFYRILQQ